MPAGRPPKPIEQLKRQGTYRADRHGGPNLAPVPPIPAEMHELDPSSAMDAVLEAGVHWIAQTDAPKVALLRDALEDYAALRAAGASAKDVREARQDVSKLMSELGFDPTARARLGLAEVKAASKLEEMAARRDARRSEAVAAEVANTGSE